MKRQNFKTEGIILGAKIIGEKDKYIFIFSRDFGKMKIVALGAKNPTSKFTGLLETLNYCKFDLYQGPKSIILTEVKTEKNYKEIRKDLSRITTGFLITKIVNDLTEDNHPIPGVLDLMDQSLEEISKTKNEDKAFLIALSFILKFLDILGLLPEFRANEFRESEHHKARIEKKYLKLLNYLNKNPINSSDNITITKDEEIIIKNIIKDIFETETEKILKLPI